MGKGAHMAPSADASAARPALVTAPLEQQQQHQQQQQQPHQQQRQQPSSAAVPTGAFDDDALARVIDMKQPLVWQVWSAAKSGAFSRNAYLQWVHTPHYFKQEPKYMQFFHNQFLELGSRTLWWMVPLIWLPCVVATLATYGPLMSTPTAAVSFFFGILYWTFMEYVLHRFLFHMDNLIPDSPLSILAHFILHGCHHKVPNDRYRLVFPPAVLVPIALVVGSLSRLAFLPIMPAFAQFAVFFSGLFFGYVVYDVMHYATHHGKFFSPKSYLGSVRRYHLKHHYNDQYTEGFGITSSFWDHVFGTVLDLRKRVE